TKFKWSSQDCQDAWHRALALMVALRNVRSRHINFARRTDRNMAVRVLPVTRRQMCEIAHLAIGHLALPTELLSSHRKAEGRVEPCAPCTELLHWCCPAFSAFPYLQRPQSLFCAPSRRKSACP